MKHHLVVAAVFLVLAPSLAPAQELIIHERKINRQRITTIACVPAPPLMVPAPGMLLPGPGPIIPGPGPVVPAPGKEPARPEGLEPVNQIDPARAPAVTAPAVQAAVVTAPAVTAVVLDATAWLSGKCFIDCQGRCWQQISGQAYPEQPIQIGGLLLQGNDGSLQFFTRSGRLFRISVEPGAAAAPGQMAAGNCASGRCPTGRCANGKCSLRIPGSQFPAP